MIAKIFEKTRRIGVLVKSNDILLKINKFAYITTQTTKKVIENTPKSKVSGKETSDKILGKNSVYKTNLFSNTTQSEKDRLSKSKIEQDNSRKKLKEVQKEENITRRDSIKQEKENQFQDKIEKLNKELFIPYTKEEYESLLSNSKNTDVILYRLTIYAKRNIKEYSKLFVFFVIPLSVSGIFLLDKIFSSFTELGFFLKLSYYLILNFDYLIFLGSIFYLLNSRKIVCLAKFLPSENVIEFTKFNLFLRETKIIENLTDLVRSRQTMDNYDCLKSKKTNRIFKFNEADREIYDKKLLNYLFPKPEAKERKKPSMVDSLWEKN